MYRKLTTLVLCILVLSHLPGVIPAHSQGVAPLQVAIRQGEFTLAYSCEPGDYDETSPVVILIDRPGEIGWYLCTFEAKYQRQPARKEWRGSMIYLPESNGG